MKIYLTRIHTVLLFLLSILFVQIADAQKPLTPEEVKAMAEELQKKATSGKMTPAELEALKKRMGVSQASVQSPARQKSETEFRKISLAGLPAQVSGVTLKTFVGGMMKKMQPKLSETQREVAEEVLVKMDTNSNYISQFAFYFYAEGDEVLALYLAGSAVVLDPDNDLNTNNFAAMLIECGAQDRAVPVMRGLVQRNPDISLFLNNMGQAFAGCGMKDSAMIYFVRCLTSEPKQPAASKTAAKISKDNGNKKDAVKYAKDALEAGTDEEMMDMLDELDPQGDHYSGFVQKKNIPDYFNLYSLKKPPHQRLPDEYEKVVAERAAFRGELERYRREIAALQNKENKLGQQELDRDMKNFQHYVLSNGKLPGPMPISSQVKKAMKIYAVRYIQYELPAKLDKLESEFNAKIEKETQAYEWDIANIGRKYADKKKPYDCGEGKAEACRMLEQLTKQECADLNNRMKIFLEACADAGDEFDRRQMQYAAEIFHHKSKWGYLVGINEHLANANYYAAAAEYLKNIEKLVGYDPVSPHCKVLEKQLATYTFAEIMKPYCPFNTNFDFGVIQTKANCREFAITLDLGKGIKALKGWKIQRKQDYIKKSTTVAVIRSFGAEVKGPSRISKMMRLNAGAKAEINIIGYVTMDGKGGDFGLKANAMAGAYAEDPMNVMDSKVHAEAGYEIGIGANSGFTHGPKGLTGFWD